MMVVLLCVVINQKPITNGGVPMDKWKLRMFFYELIKLGIDLPGRPGFGSPISWLLEQMCMYQDKLLSIIIGDFTGDSHECRLNNAGLKMYWRVDRVNDRFTCRISGDQAKDYIGFVVAGEKLIKKYNYNKREVL